ncbi:hypothetical protein KJK34_02780 [Flavobacterium sp. D11R37]|uniref:hypothetical protein n=1 Tax=Flavobacterium coralii TaxID=2838017 RepID=UPI001CA6D950|nr:hypothetical protein [Flavobacterium coralii]MBY8961671.1 hypothetical protein [Flavobacterium coralii]
MDALDKLKSDWKKSEINYPRFSEKDIYAMLHKRSSSIVKWILILSIIEFAFWLGISFLLRDSPQSQHVNNFEAGYIVRILDYVNYVIVIVFVSIFYGNYRKIKVTDNAQVLMRNILKTKRAVTNYIITVLVYYFIGFAVLFTLYFLYDPQLVNTIHVYEENGDIMWFYCIYIGIALLITGIILGGFWLFYKLLYGLLLKRLHRNYEELKKLDL